MISILIVGIDYTQKRFFVFHWFFYAVENHHTLAKKLNFLED